MNIPRRLSTSSGMLLLMNFLVSFVQCLYDLWGGGGGGVSEAFMCLATSYAKGWTLSGFANVIPVRPHDQEQYWPERIDTSRIHSM